MADDKKTAKDEGEKKTKPLVRIGIVLGVLMLFVGLEVGIALFFVDKLKPVDKTMQALKEEQEMETQKQRQLTEMGTILEKPIEVMVNIAGTEGERYLKCGVQLEFDSKFENLAGQLEMRRPKIKNVIIDILSSRPIADMMTLEGKKSIRNSIVADVNAILPDEVDGMEVGKIRRCFFDEFIIQ